MAISAAVYFNMSELGYAPPLSGPFTLTYTLQKAGSATTTVTGTVSGNQDCTVTLTVAGEYARTLSNGTDTIQLAPVTVLSTGTVLKGSQLPLNFGGPAVLQPAELTLAQFTHASVASNGASASFGGTASNASFIRAPQNGQLVDVSWEPIGANQAGTSTASFRQIGIIDQGPAGAGTAVLASLNLQSSVASFVTTAMTLAATATFSKGDIICATQAATGTDATNTVLQAGQFTLNYKPI